MDRGALALKPKPWIVPPIWQGKSVIILGGGPSLRGFDFETLRGHPIIAINAAGYDATAIAGPDDLLFGHDGSFFLEHADLVARWPGLAATISDEAVSRFNGRVQLLVTRELVDCPRGQPFVKRGRSSGHTAIALAIAGGASRVLLLGYDMRLVDGRSHYHDRYGHQSAKLFHNDFVPKFAGWDAAARRAGVDVFNVTPETALREFRRASLTDALKF